jgi:hypothetical protein
MHSDGSAAMPVVERLDEVASLLAAGFLRLKQRTCCLPLAEGVTRDNADLDGDVDLADLSGLIARLGTNCD